MVPERQPGEFEKLSSVSRMLPVRLTPASHERLRRWSTDHGFAMAVVVRGLIERFLEERAALTQRCFGGAPRPSVAW